MLVAEAAATPGCRVVAGIEAKGNPMLGRDLGELAGIGAIGVVAGDDPAALFAAADMVIDFSTPEAGVISARLARVADQVAAVSYARGRSDAQSWQQACMVKDQQGPLIAVSCDVTFGSSGAPIFSGGDDRPRIVSLVSSGGMAGQTKLAFGMALPQEVALLQSALQSGQGEIAVAQDAAVPGGVNPAWNGTKGAKFLKP